MPSVISSTWGCMGSMPRWRSGPACPVQRGLNDPADVVAVLRLVGAVEAGALNVMASFSSWKGTKMHAQQYLLTKVLKDELGFDGFIVSDWQAIARLDMQFHTAFVSGAGNSRLIRIYKTLAAESRMCIVNLEVSYPRVDVLVEEHQNLLDLLEAGDRKGLLKAIKRHMQKAVEDLTERQPDQQVTA